jgi:hypothetical protein
MPTSSAAETMHLHYPGYNGAVPYYGGSGGSVDHMAGRLGPHRSNYVDPAAYGHRYSYGGTPASAGAAPAHYLPSGMPSMAAPALPPSSPQGSYASAPMYAQSSPGSKYAPAADAHSGAGTPGSSYDAPQ